MKVFIVYDSVDEYISIVDVFSTYEKAKKCVDDQKSWADQNTHTPRFWYYEIGEFEVK